MITEHVLTDVLIRGADTHVHGISKKKKWNKTKQKKRGKPNRFIVRARMDSNAYLFRLVVLIFTANCIKKKKKQQSHFNHKKFLHFQADWGAGSLRNSGYTAMHAFPLPPSIIILNVAVYIFIPTISKTVKRYTNWENTLEQTRNVNRHFGKYWRDRIRTDAHTVPGSLQRTISHAICSSCKAICETWLMSQSRKVLFKTSILSWLSAPFAVVRREMYCMHVGSRLL